MLHPALPLPPLDILVLYDHLVIVILTMSNRGYGVVVDVDTEVNSPESRMTVRSDMLQGDLGHTDLQDDDLEFHSSSMLRIS